MSKKLSEHAGEAAELPFFAHLLSTSREPANSGGPSTPLPTYHCLDSECTKKYPSDTDETTSPSWDK